MALWINDGLHEAAQGIRSFLLVGQSNMAGRGDLTPENTITAPDCFMLRMGRWQPMSEPINVDRAVAEGAVPRSGANLAASFAAQLKKETGAKIGLIPCADGGTRISQWQPGEVLFDHAVFQAKLAARTSALTAILWHQGESDCLAPEQLEAYPEQFLRTMRAFRAELGDLPIVVGELGYPEHGFHGTPAELLKEFNRPAGAGRAAAALCRGLRCRAYRPPGWPALYHREPAHAGTAVSGRIQESDINAGLNCPRISRHE